MGTRPGSVPKAQCQTPSLLLDTCVPQTGTEPGGTQMGLALGHHPGAQAARVSSGSLSLAVTSCRPGGAGLLHPGCRVQGCPGPQHWGPCPSYTSDRLPGQCQYNLWRAAPGWAPLTGGGVRDGCLATSFTALPSLFHPLPSLSSVLPLFPSPPPLFSGPGTMAALVGVAGTPIALLHWWPSLMHPAQLAQLYVEPLRLDRQTDRQWAERGSG